MITSKTLPENDVPKTFESILQTGHRFVGNGVQQEFLRVSKCLLDERYKKLGECED